MQNPRDLFSALLGRFFLTRFLLVGILISVAAIPADAQLTHPRNGTTSDGFRPVVCPASNYVTTLTCQGSRCDNVGITCSQVGSVPWISAPRQMPFFSEENGGRSSCPADSAIVGLACDGSNCDNVALICANIAVGNYDACGETGSVSEENGILSLPAREISFGMTCSGSQCDNKTLISCGLGFLNPRRIEDPRPGFGRAATVRNDMHACPSGFVVAGVHAARNVLLCFGQTTDPLMLDRSGLKIRPAPFRVPGEKSINQCGPGKVVTGVRADRNSFTCMETSGSIGAPFVDRTTVDRDMHACPIGSVLVGIDFPTNRFLCASFSG